MTDCYADALRKVTADRDDAMRERDHVRKERDEARLLAARLRAALERIAREPQATVSRDWARDALRDA